MRRRERFREAFLARDREDEDEVVDSSFLWLILDFDTARPVVVRSEILLTYGTTVLLVLSNGSADTGVRPADDDPGPPRLLVRSEIVLTYGTLLSKGRTRPPPP